MRPSLGGMNSPDHMPRLLVLGLLATIGTLGNGRSKIQLLLAVPLWQALSWGSLAPGIGSEFVRQLVWASAGPDPLHRLPPELPGMAVACQSLRGPAKRGRFSTTVLWVGGRA